MDDGPLDLVVLVNHLCFVVRTHDPVVGTQVEVVRVSDLLRITHLNLSGFDPLDHLHVQVQVVVYCVVVELLLFNFIFLLS